MKFNLEQFEAARAALIPQNAHPLIRFMALGSIGKPNALVSNDVMQVAWNLGWIDSRTGTRTAIGFLVSDSCREYLYWKARNEALPFENALPHLSRSTFSGKNVVEIGAGMGANLMSLENTAGKLCGIEPVELYAQMGSIFRARDRRGDIGVRIGSAEALPLPDREIDLVFCVSAHQYFDIRYALPEIARVIKPGGELIIIGATVWLYAVGDARTVLQGWGRGTKNYALTMINTLSYQTFRRRVIVSRTGLSTARPIYPSVRAMMRWLNAAGFDPITPPQKAAGECCFYVRRRHDLE